MEMNINAEESSKQDVKLLSCSARAEDISEYRFLVGGLDVKYVYVEPTIVPPDDLAFEPVILRCLPTFPHGDWNEGHVVKDETAGETIFASIKKSDLPGVRNVWHKTQIDHLQLTWISRMRSRVRLVTCSAFPDPVVYKYVEFPWQVPWMEAETTAYGWIRDKDIGPRFLAHVTEAERVIGFLMEDLPGRTAEIEDLDKCERALEKLHVLGLKHGDPNKHNYLIADGAGEAVLIGLEAMTKCEDERELLAEYHAVRAQLEENTGRGGVRAIPGPHDA